MVDMGENANLLTIAMVSHGKREMEKNEAAVTTFLMPSAACCSDISLSGATTGMADAGSTV